MSDPAYDADFHCKDHGRMSVHTLPDFDEPCAFICWSCLKWRHAFRLSDPRRPAVVTIMEAMTQALYQQRQGVRD